MKKFSKKGALLFAAAMALCAFMMPSGASAASWAVVGSNHTLDSSSIGFTSPNAGGIVSNCTESQFATTVTAANDLRITSGIFRGCTSSGAFIGDCTTTSVATGLPWRADPVSTTSVTITSMNVTVRFEDMPARPGSCTNVNGATLTITGSLRDGAWSNSTRTVTFSNAEGLVSHSALGLGTPVTVRGSYRDTQQTLLINP